jgi:hypothetical protein
MIKRALSLIHIAPRVPFLKFCAPRGCFNDALDENVID